MRTHLLSIVALVAAGAAGGQEGQILASFDLQLLHGAKALPIAFESLHAAALGDRMNIVGLDEARRARHLTVDARGEVTGIGAELPLVQVTGLTACGGALVIAGVATDDRAAVLGVAADGQVAWRADVPSGERYQHWPRPVCAAGATWVFSMTSGAHGEMRLVQVAGGRFGAPVSLALADDTDTIDVLGDAEGILVARVHADGQRLELMRVAGARVTARIDVDAVRPAAPSLARVGDAIALAWVTAPSEPRLQWFDARLKPLGVSLALSAPMRGAVASVRLLATLDGKLAIAFRAREVVDDAGTVHNPNGTVTHRAPRHATPLWIAAYDSKVHHLGPLRLVDADAKFYAGDWLGSVLAMAHRGRDAYLSIFERNTRTTS